MLHGYVWSFVRFEASRVSLIHQSAKDFLSGFALSSSNTAIQSFGVSPSVAALCIASTCIRYLLLEEFATDVFEIERLSSDQDMDENVMTDPETFDFFSIHGGEHFLNIGDGLGEEHCLAISQRYGFFDYAATHWAEHFALCESIARQEGWDAVHKLTVGESYVLKNWLKYFWIKADMEFPLPGDFDALMVAAFFDCALLLDKSLCHSMPIDQPAKDRALFWAARMGCANSVQVLLRHGANPNSRRLYQHTPLTLAAHHGHLGAVKVLLDDTRTDINAIGTSGRSALSFAAGNSHLEIFQVLFVRDDCKLDHLDHNHWTPLFWAFERDHTTIGRELLSHETVDINHVDNRGRSILSWAAGEGFLQALEMLLKHPNVDVNLKDSMGRSPLLWAANNGQEEAIDALMRDGTGVEPSSKDNQGRSALSLACAGGHTNTVKALMKYKCGDVDEEDVDGWTPIAWLWTAGRP